MLAILQKIKNLVAQDVIKLEQFETSQGQIVDIEELKVGSNIYIISETENQPANGEFMVNKEGINYKIVAKEGVIETIEEVPAEQPVEPVEPVVEAEPAVEAVDEIPVDEIPVTEPVEADSKIKELEDKINELAEIVYELVKKMNGDELKKEIKTEMKVEKLSKEKVEVKNQKNLTKAEVMLTYMYK